jgi:histidyl-tRNA synthetase
MEKTKRLLADENGLDPARVESVFRFLEITGSPREVLDRLGSEFGEGSPARAGRDELAEVFRILEGSGETGAVSIDLSIARGLNYYTGTIYEVFATGLPESGAVMAGGRYDGLIGVFKGEEIPAVGISLGIDRLLDGLIKMNLIDEATGVASVLVTVFDAATAPYAAGAARALRAAGIACELYPSEGKLKKQFALASSRPGLRWAVVAGPDEASRNEVKVKDLASRTEESVPLAGLARYLREKGAGRPGDGDRAPPPSGSSP